MSMWYKVSEIICNVVIVQNGTQTILGWETYERLEIIKEVYDMNLSNTYINGSH